MKKESNYIKKGSNMYGKSSKNINRFNWEHTSTRT